MKSTLSAIAGVLVMWLNASPCAFGQTPLLGPNLAPNPSFESGAAGVPDGWRPNPNNTDATFYWSEGFGREDTFSLRITASQRSVLLANPGWATTAFVPVQSNKKYEASVFTYTPDGGVGHIPAVQFFAADGTFLGTIGATHPSGFVDPSGTWVKKTFRFDLATLPGLTNAAEAVLIVVQDIETTRGTATSVFFDDVYFGEISDSSAVADVLIDASKDGGVWWYPQAGTFDASLPHQGKALADFLRGEGMVVGEVPRTAAVTCEQLSQHHLVVAIAACESHLPDEVNAYVRYVSRGGRLLLLSDHLDACPFTDTLAQSFGLDFAGGISGTVTSFASHPITNGVTELAFIDGAAVASAPASASTLGWLGGISVMGIMPFGSGEVFYLGDTNGIEGVPQPFVNNLFGYMLSDAAPISACADTIPDVVDLINALIAQVTSYDLHHGIRNALTAKLDAAIASWERGEPAAASHEITAFINQVNAQRGKQLSEPEADALIAAAQGVVRAIRG